MEGGRFRHLALRSPSEVEHQNKVYSGASAQSAFPCSRKRMGSSGGALGEAPRVIMALEESYCRKAMSGLVA